MMACDTGYDSGMYAALAFLLLAIAVWRQCACDWGSDDDSSRLSMMAAYRSVVGSAADIYSGCVSSACTVEGVWWAVACSSKRMRLCV